MEANIEISPEDAAENLWSRIWSLPDSENLFNAIRDWAENVGLNDLEQISLQDIQLLLSDYAYTETQLKQIQNAFKIYVEELYPDGVNQQNGNGQQGGKLFWPKKYYKGLSKTKKNQRKKEIKHFTRYHWKDPRAYKGFKTDKGVKTKSSGYTQQWYKKFPNAKSLQEKSDATGVPVRFLEESYNRGMAAWRTGHRPGATEQQWGYARVHSLLMCGKTHYTTDSDIVRRAKESSKRAREWFNQQCK
jgi:hypothetical protein